jgi:glycosyltransferase involved in cell wall biosynthesis
MVPTIYNQTIVKIASSIIRHFNHPSTLIVIGSFPTSGHIHESGQDALASFTKNRITGLTPHTDKIVIITHMIGDKPSVEVLADQVIIRCIRKNHPTTYWQIASIVRQFPLTAHLVIQYEFSTFGESHMTLQFPIFLTILKTLGKHITIELHQVLTDLKQLSGHIGKSAHAGSIVPLNLALRSFYVSLGLLADRIIVLEQHLATTLQKLIPANKIYFLPHGVEQVKPRRSQLQAKTALGFAPTDFVVMSFGYLTWYKGSDLFVRTAHALSSHPNIKFCLAGGPSHNQKHKRHYQLWYRDLLKKISKTPNLTYTNFVTESDIELYYQAADLVIFPYRTFMSSSGPLSLAFSYQKPFLLSKHLVSYLSSPDFDQAISDQGISQTDLLLPLGTTLQARHILNIYQSPRILHKLAAVATSLGQSRSYQKLGEAYKSIISSKVRYTNRPTPTRSPKLASI